MRVRAAALSLLMAVCGLCPAQQRPTVAVIPFQAIGMSDGDARGLAILFESALQNAGRFTVIEQNRMDSVLKAQEISLAACTDDECAIRVGELLSAEQIVLGSVGKLGQRYYIVVKLIDVGRGASLSSKGIQKATIDELADGLSELARALSGLDPTQPAAATAGAAAPGAAAPVSPAPGPASVGTPTPAPKAPPSAQKPAALIDLRPVAAGKYVMGSADRGGLEQPAHVVTVSSLLVGKFEVTQEQYQAVTGMNPSLFRGDPRRPVEQVSWFDAVAFCNALSAREGLQPCYAVGAGTVSMDATRNGYRLPTEAEWEYVARGGARGRGFLYPGADDARPVAWHRGNYTGRTQPVGTMAANELGIHDMAGNVREWCWDWLDRYGSAAQTDPAGPVSGTSRVNRGGSYGDYEDALRSTLRQGDVPDFISSTIGFRVVRRAD